MARPTRTKAFGSLLTVLWLLILSTFASVADAALFSRNSKVKTIDQSNFKAEVMGIEKPCMVAFTAPWCGHCQRLVPEFENAAKKLDGIVKLASIDCDDEKNKQLCASFGIQGFPTLKLFPPTKKRVPRDYQGPRTAKDIGAFVVDVLPMGAKKLRVEELYTYVEKDPETPKVLLFSTKPSSSPLYRSLALDFRTSLSFAFMRGDQASVRAAARSHLGIEVSETALPLLVVLPSRKQGEPIEKGNYLTYTGQLQYYGIHNWIKENVPEASAPRKTSSVKGKKETATAKKKSAASVKPKKVSKKDGKSDNVEQEVQLPPGAQVEWKAQNIDDADRKVKMQEVAEMINQATQEAKKTNEMENETKLDQEIDYHAASQQPPQKVIATASSQEAEYCESEEETCKPKENSNPSKGKKGKASGDNDDSDRHSWSSSSSFSSSVDEDENIEKDQSASYSTHSSSSSSDQPPLDSSYTVHSHTSSSKSHSSDDGEDSERISLEHTLQKWLEGENIDWTLLYSKEFEKAKEQATQLLMQDSEKANQIAQDGEKWLLDHLSTDLEMMKLVRESSSSADDDTKTAVSDEKYNRVESMYNEIKKRIQDRKKSKYDEEEEEKLRSHDEL